MPPVNGEQYKDYRKNILFWNVPGKEPIEEILENLQVYKNIIDETGDKNIKPEGLINWFKNIGIEKIYNEFIVWKNNIEKNIDKKEQEMNKLEKTIHILEKSIEFNNKLDLEIKEKIINEIKNSETPITIDKFIPENRNSVNDINIIWEGMVSIINEQVEEEIKIIDEEKSINIKSENIEKNKKIIDIIENIIKNELGKNSILISNVVIIPKEELNSLTKTLNSILRFFHFSVDFLPLKIENIGTKTKPKYSIVTNLGKDISYTGLSTGQKSQVAISWLIGINYLMSEKLPHKIIIFDDITTSLDLSQLASASILFRKMAYSDKNNRQVIISSHHDDLTNRLVDYLMPPAGKKMKVIYFSEWSISDGPKYKIYDISKPEPKDENYYSNKEQKLIKYLKNGDI